MKRAPCTLEIRSKRSLSIRKSVKNLILFLLKAREVAARSVRMDSMRNRADPSMKAIVREASGVRLVERPVPQPARGWVRMRVLLAGICRTDLYAAEGRLEVGDSRVLGHELVGVIDARSEDDRGDHAPMIFERATVSPIAPCGACVACARDERC